MMIRTIHVFLVLLIFEAPSHASDIDTVTLGKGVYSRYCVGCHGEKGDGLGKGSMLLVQKPRNFTQGVYELKSTPPGSLPTDLDLMRTLSRGIPGTAMPSFSLLPEAEKQAVIGYIKTFSARWKAERPPRPLAVPSMSQDFGGVAAIENGKKVYADKGCAMCHGERGDGLGMLAPSLKNTDGFPETPRNFLRGLYEGGDAPEDVFRTISTGLEGTPMPAFAGTMTDQELWDLISYILSLKGHPMPKEG